MRVEFKAAAIADETVLLELRREFQAFESFPAPLDEATNKAVLRQLLENENFGKIWLILCDDEVVGYVVLTFGFSLEYAGRDALIDELFLRETARGRGVGQQAIVTVEDFCRSQHIKAAHLEVEHENAAARNLYHKTGFVDYKRRFLTKWID